MVEGKNKYMRYQKYQGGHEWYEFNYGSKVKSVDHQNKARTMKELAVYLVTHAKRLINDNEVGLLIGAYFAILEEKEKESK